MDCGEKIVIGVAGNIGSGKTTVCKIFEKFGAHYISADELGWEVLPEIADKLKKRFGDVVMNSGTIDKKRLREVIFSRKEHVEYLNSLSHPLLVAKILENMQKSNAGMTIIDAALLFDWPKIYKRVNYTILIVADKEIKEARAMAEGINRFLFRKILAFQKNDAEISKHASFIIKNNGTTDELKKQCQDIYEEIKNDC
jgi:dephospho-CoA kinase